ncbi:MAG: hypothetical protein IKE28_12030 [Solobacterium sp.]|nr:hypothetical protein [Solobacterium sp.]
MIKTGITKNGREIEIFGHKEEVMADLMAIGHAFGTSSKGDMKEELVNAFRKGLEMNANDLSRADDNAMINVIKDLMGIGSTERKDDIV